MGKSVYFNEKDLEAYEVLSELFRITVEAGGIFGGPDADEKEHERICEAVGNLNAKVSK